ncbi:MAG: hypothetical protein HZY75_05920 [Nocardioidaceae bacterium]|nr:MAG: hypothetical protein HZY75_05920 [Nocardioidaceae bacterium]
MRALTVRWSLTDAPDTAAQELRSYVEDSSHARFTAMPGLGFKTWRMRPADWFEGCYVFGSDSEREAFQTEFTAGAAQSPVSVIVGSPPVLIEPCEVVGVAEGAAGFSPTPNGEPAA